MYLKSFQSLQGLGACTPGSQWSAFWGAGGDSSSAQASCRAQGGSFMIAPAGWSGSCQIPAQCVADAAPSISSNTSVVVPTSVNTQVSPQISPNLIQQQQPTNSGITASTKGSPAMTVPSAPDLTQAANTANAQGGTTPQAYLDILNANNQATQKALADQAAADRAAQQAQIDEFMKVLAAKNAGSAQPAQQVTTQFVPSGDSGASSQQTTAIPPDAGQTNYLPYIVLAAAAVLLMTSGKKGHR